VIICVCSDNEYQLGDECMNEHNEIFNQAQSLQQSYGEENDLNLKSIIAISRAAQMLHHQAAKNFKEGDLTIAQFSVLEILYHKGDMRICEIINKTLSTSGNMTVVIENLVKAGHIQKCVDHEDRRAMKIHLNQSGRDIIESIFPNHLLSMKQLFEPLENHEKIELINLLKKLTRYQP
jgi:MarR family transcriptional regulator, 2-MHQ and catechol-resistance regulon repressor